MSYYEVAFDGITGNEWYWTKYKSSENRADCKNNLYYFDLWILVLIYTFTCILDFESKKIQKDRRVYKLQRV